jgi:hydrogenase maturation protease
MKSSKQVAVVGVGNLLFKDEGVGIHVAHALQKLAIPQGVKIVDGGTSPEILAYVEPAEKLIIIDAIEAGGTPGAVYRFRLDDLTTEAPELISVHEIDLISRLKMMRLLGKGPQETVVIGVQPKEIGWGTELSSELQEKIPEIGRVVLEEIGINQQESDLVSRMVSE